MKSPRCTPPFRWLFPPEGTDDWRKIAFQPMLYFFLWLGALTLLIFGGFFTDQPTFIYHSSLFWTWGGLSLFCPPLALVSLHLVTSPSGRKKYFGLWVRLAADVGQFVALVVYLAQRFRVDDIHIYGQFSVVSCAVFVGHLVGRDVSRIISVEQLASKIESGKINCTPTRELAPSLQKKDV